MRAPAKVRLAAEILRAYVFVRRAQFRTDLPTTLSRVRAAKPHENGSGVTAEAGVRLGWAVARTLPALRVDSKCLTQSLVLTRLLARRGADSKLVIAVRPGDSFGAHAWVELDERPLLPPMDEGYVRLVDL